MKKILFPTDFTNKSKNAIKFGLSIFNNEPCEILLLNTFQIPTPIHGEPIPIDDQYKNEVKQSFTKLKKALIKEFKNAKFSFKDYYEIGELTQITSSFIEKHNIDLIILGIRNNNGIVDLLFGNSSSSIILNVKCPVLAIPAETPFIPPKNIAIAIDDKYDINDTAIRPLTNIARKFNAELFIIHISNGVEMNKNFDFDGLDNYFKDLDHSYRIMYDFDVSNGIEDFVKNYDISMIGVLTHKLSFIKQIFHSSVSRKLVLNAKAPIFSMNIEKIS